VACRFFSILETVHSARGRSPAAHGGGDNGYGGRGGGGAVLCAEPAAVAEGGGGQRGSRRRQRRVEIEQIGAPEKAFEAAGAGSGDAAGVDRNAVGDSEVHVFRDFREVANRRFGLRHQLLHAQAGKLYEILNKIESFK